MDTMVSYYNVLLFSFMRLYHTMGVLPSTQPVATLGSSIILSSFDVACTCCVPYAEATVFGVGHTLPFKKTFKDNTFELGF